MSLKTIMKSQGTNVAQQLIDTALNVGKSAIHAAMPDDFEYYLCSLELVNHKDERKGFLSFSVMPEQISESYTPIQTMIKTHNAVVTLFNDSFAPVDINIAGTFGRKIRLLLNYKDPWYDNSGNGIKILQSKKFISLDFGKVAGMEVGVKTGYGMTKILQHILAKATTTDADNHPYYLKFYNYALNTAYIVDVVNYTMSQSMGSNMIWNYQMTLRAVAPLSSFSNIGNKMKNLLPEVASNSVANGVTNIVNGMTRLF